MSRNPLLAAVCVAVIAAGCSAQSPDRPSEDKPEGNGAKKDGAKAKSLDDLTRGIAGEADAALKAKPDDIEAIWNKANAEFHLKDYKASRVAVDAGLKKSADDPRFRFLLAALHSMDGESEEFKDAISWFIKRDICPYLIAARRLMYLTKKEVRENFHDAYQAAWLITEGYTTPETKAALDRVGKIGATALLTTAWSPWHRDEQNQCLKTALVELGVPARPSLEFCIDDEQKQLEKLTDAHKKLISQSNAMSLKLLFELHTLDVKEKLEKDLSAVQASAERHDEGIKYLNRQLLWMKETIKQIKD